MKSIIENIFSTFVSPRLDKPLRRGAIQTVRGYIQAVRLTRLGVMGVAGLGVAGGLMTSGLVLMIVGGLALLPLTDQARFIIELSVGAVLFSVPAILLLNFFSVRRWMEMSKADEFVKAAVAPWPSVVPVLPSEVVAELKAQFEHRDHPTSKSEATIAEPTTPTPPTVLEAAGSVADEFSSVAAPIGSMPIGWTPVVP